MKGESFQRKIVIWNVYTTSRTKNTPLLPKKVQKRQVIWGFDWRVSILRNFEVRILSFWSLRSPKNIFCGFKLPGMYLELYCWTLKSIWGRLKTKIWQNCIVELWNESWKFQKIIFAKKSRFHDEEVIFWQVLLFLYYFGHVLSISEIRNAFWSILRRIFG